MRNQIKNWIIIFLFQTISVTLFGQSTPTHLDSLKSSMDTLDRNDLPSRHFEIARQHLENYPEPDSFNHYLNLAIQEAKNLQDNKLLFECYYYKGVQQYRSSNYEQSISYLDSAEKVSHSINDSLALAKMMYTKGVMYNHLGENEKFHESLLKAIEIARALKNVTIETTCLIALSQKAKELQLYDQQYDLLYDAYGHFEEISSRSKLILLIQLASYHTYEYNRSKKKEEINTANDFINRGIKLATKLKNQALLTDLWMKRLHVKDINNQFDQEYLDLSDKILEKGKQMKDPFFTFKGNVFKGLALTELNQPEKAVALETPVLKYAEILGEPQFYRDGYNMLKNAASLAKNYKKALHFNEQFIIYNDSINNLEKAKTFTNALQKYESEKKEKEIILLQRNQQKIEFDAKQKESQLKQNLMWLGLCLISILFFVFWNNTRQKQKVSQLQYESSQNEQKLLRSQMNPHFLFNSLNSIKRFYIDGRIEEANDFMADFGNLLRQILEQSSKPFISIEEELEFLTLYLELEKRRLKKELNYTINFDKDQFDFEDQIPSLILQPLVENSIWHGIMKTEKSGEITITVEKNKGNIKCSVLDNGIGYFATNKSKTHSYTSRGLELIKDRIGKTGQFQIHSIFDSNGSISGTMATLIFKPYLE